MSCSSEEDSQAQRHIDNKTKSFIAIFFSGYSHTLLLQFSTVPSSSSIRQDRLLAIQSIRNADRSTRGEIRYQFMLSGSCSWIVHFYILKLRGQPFYYLLGSQYIPTWLNSRKGLTLAVVYSLNRTLQSRRKLDSIQGICWTKACY